MVVTTKMFVTSGALTLLVIFNVHAGPLSNSLLLKKGQISAQDNEKLIANEGHNIQRRFVRGMHDESLENSKTPPYGHPGPSAPSFNTQHQGPYSHQYHNQFFEHHHNPHFQPHHFSYGHYPHHNFHHYHHHHDQDCDHSNSDSSGSSEENHHKNNKPYPSGNGNELPYTSSPESKSTEADLPTTTETTFDIDVRLGNIS